MHECPECGRLTEGSVSEGGCRWALCPDCFNDRIEEGRRELAEIEISHSFCIEGVE